MRFLVISLRSQDRSSREAHVSSVATWTEGTRGRIENGRNEGRTEWRAVRWHRWLRLPSCGRIKQDRVSSDQADVHMYTSDTTRGTGHDRSQDLGRRGKKSLDCRVGLLRLMSFDAASFEHPCDCFHRFKNIFQNTNRQYSWTTFLKHRISTFNYHRFLH